MAEHITLVGGDVPTSVFEDASGDVDLGLSSAFTNDCSDGPHNLSAQLRCLPAVEETSLQSQDGWEMGNTLLSRCPYGVVTDDGWVQPLFGVGAWQDSESLLRPQAGWWNRAELLEFEELPSLSSYHPSGPNKSLSALPSLASSERGPHHICPACRRAFQTVPMLEEHAKLAGHRPFVCAQAGCRKSYQRQDVFLRHSNSHRTWDVHTCEICLRSDLKRTFNRKDHLQRHLRTRHANSEAAAGSDGFQEKPTLRHAPATTALSQKTSPGAVSPAMLSKSSLLQEDPIDTQWSKRKRSPDLRHPDVTSSPSKIVEDIAVALRTILGEDNVVVRAIESRPNPEDDPDAEKLALSLARLALVQPGELPDRTKEQLRQTSQVAQAIVREVGYPAKKGRAW
ncbi:hypothetical protein LTR85_003283 [Meristemomyces frigidus]|nr:hypothetical protein LTR85_003283 [Meristemomyces frigidus]